LGGGAVWLSLQVEKMYVNDLCQELITFYEILRDQNEDFFVIVNEITKNWQFISDISKKEANNIYNNQNIDEIINFLYPYREQLENSFFALQYREEYFDVLIKSLKNKIKNIHKIESKKGKLPKKHISKNIKCALKSGFYTMIRNIFNKHKEQDALRISCFYFLRDYCFSSMFKYNVKGEFNVPYGGISYNDKLPNWRIKNWKNPKLTKHLQSTCFNKVDFYDFFQQNKPTKNDFIFVDPPYDSDFSTYADNTFGVKDQKRLADYLINECEANFMAIMKNIKLIRSLYENKKGIICLYFDKNYSVSFKDRNDRAVEHVIIVRK